MAEGGNALGFAALDAEIRRLRELAKLPEQCALPVAEALRDEVAAAVARGQGADGEPLELTKEGQRPFQGILRALSAAAAGTVAIVRLEGPIALHHLGRARGGITRRILPTRKLNAPVVRALQRVCAERFERVMGDSSGGRR